MKSFSFLASIRALLSIVAVFAVLAPRTIGQPILYGLTSTNSLLIIGGDGAQTLPGPQLSGFGPGESAVSIDFRPFTSELYALTRDSINVGRIYKIDPVTGAAASVTLSGAPLLISGTAGIDFNPVAVGGTNALRIVTSDEQNYRLVFNSDGATVNMDGSLNVAGGASGTNVIATAYSNNAGGLPGGAGAGGTVQYAIDSDTDRLYRVNPPNNGVLTNGVPLGVDIAGMGGFDIVTGTGRAVAILSNPAGNGLYDVNLATGAGTLVASLPGEVIDIAAPIPAARPTPLVYGLTSSNSLARFSADGGPVVFGPALSGFGAGETIVGIDFRPLTSELYALSRDAASQGRLYTVNLVSGALTPVALSGPTIAVTGEVSINFNPAAATGNNALRIVTSDEQNYRLVFSAAGATVNVDTSLNVVGGASGTNIIATAYSNNRAGLPGAMGAGGTTQYAVDSDTDTLYRVNPPNGGVLTNALPLGVDISSGGGLDIVTGSNRALGLFATAGTKAIFEVNLSTGTASLLRFIPDNIMDLAVPMPVVIPSAVIVGLTSTNSLVTFNTDGSPVATGPVISGLAAGEAAVGIDFRPLNGQLYVVTRDTTNVGRLYTVDPASGMAASVPLAGPEMSLTGSVGIDFNPAAASGTNALRIVTSDEKNYRLVFTDDGATVNVDGALNVAGASATNIVGTAYSNNRAGIPGGGGVGGTAQYAIDSELDLLYRVNPPNNGTLTEPKPLGLDVRSVGGLDITTGDDRALAVFDVVGSVGLYEVSLAGGAASLIRSLPSNVIDLALPTPLSARIHTVGGLTMTASGGVGPFAVQRADVVTDPFCGIGVVAARAFSPTNEGAQGFLRLADLAASPAIRMSVILSGASERPTPVATTADGFGTLEISGSTLSFNIGYRGLSGAATLAHIHGPADTTGAASVLIDLVPFNGGAFGQSGTLIGSVTITAEQKAALLGGLTYVNIHTMANGGGEIRGQITPVTFQAILSGAAERPSPTSSPATGFAFMTVLGRELAFDISYSGLTGPATLAHIHGPAPSSSIAGVLIDLAPFSVGPLAASGRFVGKVTLTVDQLAAVADGFTYVNIHTALFGGGEVRGQVRPIITGIPFSAALEGAAQRPNPVVTTGSGFGSFILTGDSVSFQISYRNLSGPVVAAHFHGPAPASGTAGVQIDLTPFHRGPFSSQGWFTGSITLTPEQKAAFLAGDFYVNLHTTMNPDGEIRAQIVPVVFQSILTGAAERPTSVTTNAKGAGYLAALGKQLSVGIRYSDLTGPATLAHIHGPGSPDEAVGVLIDLMPLSSGNPGASGFFLGSLSLSDASTAALADGLTYVNIHTAMFGGGEIRGQIVP